MNKRDNICTYILAMESTEYTPSLRQWSFNYDGVWTNNRSRQRFGRISFWTDGRTNERTKFLFIHQAWNHLRGRMPVCLSVCLIQSSLSLFWCLNDKPREKKVRMVWEFFERHFPSNFRPFLLQFNKPIFFTQMLWVWTQKYCEHFCFRLTIVAKLRLRFDCLFLSRWQ